jgi:hypothetical protein
MKNFLIIKDGTVTNFIVAESIDIAQEASESGSTCIEYKNNIADLRICPQVGFNFDGNVFTNPNNETFSVSLDVVESLPTTEEEVPEEEVPEEDITEEVPE